MSSIRINERDVPDPFYCYSWKVLIRDDLIFQIFGGENGVLTKDHVAKAREKGS